MGVVVDTMVISWLFEDRPNTLADRYRDLIGRQPVLLAFQTVMELRYGALRAGWGELRRRRLERRVAELAVVQPDNENVSVCSELRFRCQQSGHALGDKLPRWRPLDRSHRHAPRCASRLPRPPLQERAWTRSQRPRELIGTSDDRRFWPPRPLA